ncbi:MAG: class I SAM-dependent methyltransferase [Acidobacteriota bacterium]
MPTIERNRSLWSEYDWSQRGEEWSVAWGGSQFQWQFSILPRIQSFLPAGTILEIGTGWGRWTNYLKHECDELIGVDLSPNCIEYCRERFADDRHLSLHINDGNSLAMVPDGSIDFVFSFDSLVHAEADVLSAYIVQLAKKLKPDGVGFIHHSNLGAYRFYYSMKRMIPKGRGLLWRMGLLDNDGLRALSMSAEAFEECARNAGLKCISQEIINWASKRLIDCISIFTPAGSKWARPNVVTQNPNFMKEAEDIRNRSGLQGLG